MTDKNDDVVILVDFHEPGMENVGFLDDGVEKSKEAIERALKAIEWIAERAVDTLNRVHHKPSQAEIEFGIKVEAEAGKLIAKASVESHITVKLIWKKLGDE